MPTPALIALSCTPAAGRGLLALLSLAALLAAAKAHGRQLRLERVRAGYTRVVFGGDNPPAVVRLWRRDRLRLWTVAAAVAVVVAALVAAGRWPVAGGFGAAWGLVFVPLVSGFVVSGLASLLGLLARADEGRAFTRAALPGSVGWWGLVATLLAAAMCAAGHV